MNGIKFITVAEDDEGQRLDRWLKKQVPDVSYVLLQKLIRKGALRIDGKRVKTDTRLIPGQQVKIPAAGSGKKIEYEVKMSAKDKAYIKSLVIYDEGDIIALNKPAGLAVQGGSKTFTHVDGLLDGLKNEQGVRPKLVHRLDKDTSGLLLIARSTKMARRLGDAFKSRNVKKTYVALVKGVPEVKEGTIKASIEKSGGLNRERMRVNEETGKTAITEYTVIDTMGSDLASIAFWPRTGRTHQLRVHAEIAGFPIVGDNKYRGHSSEADEILEGLDLADRLHLHALRIAMPHPSGHGTLEIEAPLSLEMKKSWQTAGFDPRLTYDPFENIKT